MSGHVGDSGEAAVGDEALGTLKSDMLAAYGWSPAQAWVRPPLAQPLVDALLAHVCKFPHERIDPLRHGYRRPRCRLP